MAPKREEGPRAKECGQPLFILVLSVYLLNVSFYL